ncbi:MULTISPECIES: tRNA (adenosine(37)-N6)-threonylcarbamoyltransferase complex ATPase subunit type 1 TsaE [unclassified Sulfuricurvum]|uniref:tRNA (adenosine(37)-N6)-threonylcarbamoyltransferase complex ATPase subunit type 1 TsaE n=1 Tax=unclassified Sulfuricurvum TaxID=2632390 RepID=UPI0002999850|nr:MULTISPECIES: tRNA (adenosine(37)-N6)-threonylcarbamoyltransferase complex ATPase subunit type 1 TsaE [unclassified Sulfuricurvum]OHD83598.1 MAG: tRNA (adenosine(37)-N6)-threonylcarbamoyltransferase complex ATPase subunit type 1 TsaE [Sulfuricurvum sp. RIFCSPHIGHO2_02_FULL_43_9]OHD84047.1 MAG: tRNA (adenosine(37)-N6)-threonylcarbamoyltransferase complex ATPase subunit type 1 TsaE [Sulfuricurvum sp. RIFCSPHIGHO2_12_FULL_44_8]OHD84812.1 MAG: tRNA (adenosine(37)-N6)-threonylcarbamoyltransferase 
MNKLTLDELPQLCSDMTELLPQGGVVILQGDLASGKTTFTQAFARFLGVGDSVTSPTFSLQQRYGEKLYHYDLYNYGFEKFLSLGMMEELEHEGYHLIEWGDEPLINLLKRSGIETLIVKIIKCDETSRWYEVQRA